MSNEVIFYHPDAYTNSGFRHMGSNAAVEYFLLDFFSHSSSSEYWFQVQQSERQRLGANARAFAQQHYDLKTVCLPKQLHWVNGLVNLGALKVAR